MEHKKKIMLSLAMVAVIAVAAVGIGFAYTASTVNTGNNVGAGYMTLTPTSDGYASQYSASFNGNVTYDTLKVSDVLTYYNLSQQDLKEYPLYHDPGLIATIEAQKIGGLILKIDTTNVSDDYVIEMVDTAGTMSNKYTYKVGYSYGTTAEAVIAPVSQGETTYKEYFLDYTPGTMITIEGAAGDSTLADETSHMFHSTVAYVAINLYVTDAVEQSAPLEAALTDVTFRFTASSVDPSNVHTVVLNVTGGTVTADKQLTAIYGNEVTLVLTVSEPNRHIESVEVGGTPIDPDDGKYTIPLAGPVVTVNITVEADS